MRAELSGLIISCLVAGVTLAPSFVSGALGEQRSMSFVALDAGRLVTSEGPWSPVGYNDYRLTSMDGGYVCDPASGAIDDDELGERLDRIRASGANVIRTWFFQSYWDPFADGSAYSDSFDRVLDAAEERGIRVVPVLANHWAACEAGRPEKKHDFYAGEFRRSEGDALSYLDYVRQVAERYADSPAIAYWELVNEPEAPTEDACEPGAAAEALATFAGEAGAAIREVDPNHLISLGVIGGEQCGVAGDAYAEVQAEMDVCGIHVYGADPVVTASAVERISACEDAGKPIVVDEIGIEADVDLSGAATGTVSAETLEARAALLEEKLDVMSAEGLDGFLLWQMGPETPTADAPDPFEIGPCDPISDVVRRYVGAEPAVSPECEGEAGLPT